MWTASSRKCIVETDTFLSLRMVCMTRTRRTLRPGSARARLARSRRQITDAYVLGGMLEHGFKKKLE